MHSTTSETIIIYPSSDGKPMADSTIQYNLITKIKGNLDGMFLILSNSFSAQK